jgi:hypothetical protein
MRRKQRVNKNHGSLGRFSVCIRLRTLGCLDCFACFLTSWFSMLSIWCVSAGVLSVCTRQRTYRSKLVASELEPGWLIIVCVSISAPRFVAGITELGSLGVSGVAIRDKPNRSLIVRIRQCNLRLIHGFKVVFASGEFGVSARLWSAFRVIFVPEIFGQARFDHCCNWLRSIRQLTFCA